MSAKSATAAVGGGSCIWKPSTRRSLAWNDSQSTDALLSIRRIHHYHSIAALGSKDPTAHPFPDCKNARASWHSAIERLFEVTEQCDRIALYSRKGFSYRARHRWQPKGTASRKSPYSFRIRGRSRPRARRRGCALSLGRWLAAMACALAGLGWGLLGRTCFM